MLVAFTVQKQQVVITTKTSLHYLQQLRQTTSFYCPQCLQPVQLKIGRVKIPHFAHKQWNACERSFADGESPTHLLGKQQLYSFFKKRVENVVLEAYLTDLQQRPDILLTYQQQRYAVEFQCSPLSHERFHERTAGYQKHDIIPIWIVKVPRKITSFGIQKISLSPFYQQFIKHSHKQLYIITYDVSQSCFLYVSNLNYLQGHSWLANVQPLSVDTQQFPFYVPRLLNEKQCQEMIHLYKIQRSKYLRAKVMFNRKGVNDLFLRGLYEQRLSYEQLPNFIGIPINGGEAIPLFGAEWQGHLFYFMHIFKLNVWQVDQQKIWFFLKWAHLPQNMRAVSLIERYLHVLCLLKVDSIATSVADTMLHQLLLSELIAFSK